MRRQLKKGSAAIAVKKQNRVPEAVFLGGLTAAVAVFGAGLTWWSSNQTLKQSMYDSCVKRVDEQESKLRDKAGVFLALRAEWQSKNINPNMKKDEYYLAGEKAIAAANDLSMHAPLRLGAAAMDAGFAIQQIMSAQTREEIARVREEIKKDQYDLLSVFFKEMDDYQALRSGCRKVD